MIPAHVVQIATPKKYELNGLWFGPKKPRKIIVLMHGLTGSTFSLSRMVQSLTNSSTAVLTFNNRGFGQINSIKKRKGKSTDYSLAGTTHEVFTDSIDDIDGAIRLAKRHRVKEIYLAGHSTGCQKVVYWASKRSEARVKALILFGPLSDYSGAVSTKGRRSVERGVKFARTLIAQRKPHALMPKKFVEWFECDAQRYVSLYSPDSTEEIFPYARPERVAGTLKKVRIPILILLAGADEHGDRSPKEIAAWFKRHMNIHDVVIVPKVGHSFRGGEYTVAKTIREFMKDA